MVNLNIKPLIMNETKKNTFDVLLEPCKAYLDKESSKIRTHKNSSFFQKQSQIKS